MGFRRFHRLLLAAIIMLSTGGVLEAQSVLKHQFKTESDRRQKYELDDWVSYLKNRIYTGATTGSDYLYIGTGDGGILRYHLYDNAWDYPFTTSSGLPSNQIIDLAYDPQTAFLHVKTRRDEAIFNPASETWIHKRQYPLWDYQFPDRDAPSSRIHERFSGRDELFSLPTFFANGDYSITGDWQLIDNHFQEFTFSGAIRDRYDRIWFFIDGFGVGLGDLYSQRADFFEIGLPDVSLRAMAFQSDDIWVGGLGQDYRGSRPGIGLWPAEGIGWRYFQARWINRLPNDNINDILVDGDSVWFASEYGVSLYDRAEVKWRNWDSGKGLPSDNVLDVEILGDQLFAATDFGIATIDLDTGQLRKSRSGPVTALPFNRLAVQQDTLWAATYRGIFRLTAGKDTWEFVSSRASVQDFDVSAVDALEEQVWFAASQGIFRYDSDSDDWRSFHQIGFEVPKPYRDIAVTETAVFVATAGGLLKFDRSASFWRLFTTEDGLLNNDCQRLLLDGDYIWIVTNAGLTQFYWNNPNRSDY